MNKFTETYIGFREVPDEISLCINISNCPYNCKGCHSPHLAEDIGNLLDIQTLDNLIKTNKGITCVCFMGGHDINELASYIKENHKLKVAWYNGSEFNTEGIELNKYSYIKFGPYKEELGGLDNPKTNQRMYEVAESSSEFVLVDITKKFWNRCYS